MLGLVKGPVASSKIVNIYTFDYLKIFTVFYRFLQSVFQSFPGAEALSYRGSNCIDT